MIGILPWNEKVGIIAKLEGGGVVSYTLVSLYFHIEIAVLQEIRQSSLRGNISYILLEYKNETDTIVFD